VQQRLVELLAAKRARIDAAYFCPHHPQFPGPGGASCECRKPGLKLFREAQAAFDIDFSRSWWIGDRLSDVQPARLLGATRFWSPRGMAICIRGRRGRSV